MRTCTGEFTGIVLIAICSLGAACSSSSGSTGGSGASSATPGNSAAGSSASGNGVSESPGDDGGGQSSGTGAVAVDDAGQAADAADASPCAAYTGTVDSYSADLTRAGTSGQLQFVLVGAQPAPPAMGNNTWTLKVLDASGAPIQNATFAIKTWMPMMHHGSSIAPRQAANADGTYSVSSLYLIMAGIWQVTFTAQAGSMKDSAVYTFCIGG